MSLTGRGQLSDSIVEHSTILSEKIV